jgi:hypothetical protein
MFGAQFLLRSVDGSMKVCLNELQLFLPPKGGGLITECELHNVCAKLSEYTQYISISISISLLDFYA